MVFSSATFSDFLKSNNVSSASKIINSYFINQSPCYPIPELYNLARIGYHINYHNDTALNMTHVIPGEGFRKITNRALFNHYIEKHGINNIFDQEILKHAHLRDHLSASQQNLKGTGGERIRYQIEKLPGMGYN
jgi:hypothetical protein